MIKNKPSINESSNNEESVGVENNDLNTRRKMTDEEEFDLLMRIQKIHKNRKLTTDRMNKVFSQDTFVRVRKQTTSE